MSELNDKIVAEIDKVYSFSPYDTKRECETAKNNSKAAKAIEILVLEEKIKLLDKIYKLSDTIELFKDLNYELHQLKQQ